MRRRVLAPKVRLDIGKGGTHEALVHHLKISGVSVDRQNDELDVWAKWVLEEAIKAVHGPYWNRLADVETQKKVKAAKAALKAKEARLKELEREVAFLRSEIPDIDAANERPAIEEGGLTPVWPINGSIVEEKD